MDSFLQQTARSIIETTDWELLNRTTFVLPSQRAGLVLKEELLRLQQEAHAQAVWAPRVKTLTQLQDELSPLYPEDELFTVVRLYRLYKSLSKGDIMPLDMFYGWGRQMVADFSNIDAAMSQEEVPHFFANSIAAHELEQWKLDPDTESRLKALINPGSYSAGKDSVRSYFEDLWQNLYSLYTDLNQQMAAENKGYPGMRQRAVITRWEEESVQTQIAGRTYIFVGFNYLLPVERELMTLLRDNGQARFYWDYVADFDTNEKAFSFTKINSNILGSELPPREWGPVREVSVIACVSREAQAQYVHQWLKENYTRKGQRVGVVICDETMLEPVIYAIPAITLEGENEPSPVNITKGFPLRNTAVYARLMEWMAKPERGKAETIVTPQLMDELIDYLFPVQESDMPEQEEAKPVGWQELLVLESEFQVRKIINRMRLLLTSGIGEEPFTLKLLRLLFRRMMESVTMPFHGEPVTDIQIMGVLETRLLDFDRLLLLNVEEGIIPQKQSDNSFIPYYLRKTYHMQTPDERATVYAYNFFRLLSRTSHATLLYASADTAEGGKGQSRFILQMRYSDHFNVVQTHLSEPALVKTTGMDEMGKGRSMESLLHVGPDGFLYRQDGHPFRLSPSALNTYISCPRSFYLQYIMGIKPPQDEEVLYAPNTMGSFVHHMMEYIYRNYLGCTDSAVTRVTPEAIGKVRDDDQKMQEALDAVYQIMNDYIQDHHTGENVIIKGYVRNILDRDIEDAKNGLQIVLLEKERMFTLEIPGIGKIWTGGTIDRLDICGQDGAERLRVVDYKSGSYTDSTHDKKMSASWDDIMTDADKSYVRQTMVYSRAVKEHDHTGLPVEPNLFFCRRKLTGIVTTIDVENETVHDFAAVQERFTSLLADKIKELLTADSFPLCEPDKCPSYCPFFVLCGRKPAEF